MSGSRINITLSADAGLVQRTREYATQRNTTLNQLVRDHMKRLTGGPTAEEAAQRFIEVARQYPGRSPDDYRFDRGEIHERRR